VGVVTPGSSGTRSVLFVFIVGVGIGGGRTGGGWKRWISGSGGGGGAATICSISGDAGLSWMISSGAGSSATIRTSASHLQDLYQMIRLSLKDVESFTSFPFSFCASFCAWIQVLLD
jgi:hypothetical protein